MMMDTPRTTSRSAARMLLWQVVLLVTVWAGVVGLHADNNGLWYQGDAPRHAAMGIFYWDLLTSLPRHPIDFALGFYARYPIISPGMYPPAFHILEGLAFRIFGISPYVAKMLVLAFLLLAGFYLLAWLRRWSGVQSGWAAPLLFLMPGIILYSHAILLNVPAMALCLAGLYHGRCWIEKRESMQLYLTALFLVLATCTYYQAAIAVVILAIWLVVDRRSIRFLKRRGIFLFLLLLLASISFLWAVNHWAPVLTTWVLPQWRTLADLSQWAYYAFIMPGLFGTAFLVLALIGLLGGLMRHQQRKDASLMLLWLIAIYLAFSFMPAKDDRYILLMAPALIILAALGIRVLVESARISAPSLRVALWAGGLILAGWLCVLPATRWAPLKVKGFEGIAAFFEKQAPNEAIFYNGLLEGVFGFYICSQDRGYHQRVVLGDQLLYASQWWETFSIVNSKSEALEMITKRSGCRWLAIERGPQAGYIAPEAYLRRAVTDPECELVRSFLIQGHGEHRVDVYRLRAPVDPLEKVDLNFPLLGSTTFKNVQPIKK